jgi:hypothetical protein
MVGVPNVAPDTEPLRKNPVFLYFQDNFKKPNPFQPDIAVDITPVIEKKIAGLDAHQSQFYEWLPWVGNYEEEVPKDPSKYKAYLLQKRVSKPNADVQKSLEKWYGTPRAAKALYAEPMKAKKDSAHMLAVYFSAILASLNIKSGYFVNTPSRSPVNR